MKDFYTEKGVIIGEFKKHTDVLGRDNSSYDMTFHLENGYSIRIEPGDYPEEIEYYLGYAPALAACPIVMQNARKHLLLQC